MPEFYPGTDIPTQEGRVLERRNTRGVTLGRQFVLSPRVSLEPVKGWVTNVEVNYILNNDRNVKTDLQSPWVRPNGDIAYAPTKETTKFIPALNTNEYLSPSA